MFQLFRSPPVILELANIRTMRYFAFYLVSTWCSTLASTGTASHSLAPCASNIDCSLNGVCNNGVCDCDRPWKGPSCGVLGYKVSPASGKSLYPISDPKNTWNGPIVGPDEKGKYHLYDPIYPEGNLLGCTNIKHGVADNVTGPYRWDVMPDISGRCNPAFVTYTDAVSGKTKYTLWPSGSEIQTADSPDGPFTPISGTKGVAGGNPAPLYHNGAFYATSQSTRTVVTATDLSGPWTVFANISVPVPRNVHVEDPFMWIDKRGNWHIVNHAYDVLETENCANSTLSAHTFSADGKNWHMLVPTVEPYTHTVEYDDGTSHTYTTLERPNIHFDSSGQMTHINLAADLVTGNEGCKDIPNCFIRGEQGHCACTNCKYTDHAGTIIVALDV
eukprot:m.64433 g.64433  ORF g.64433 m.64433 type:complete len:388 (+) comp15879_c0_seq6:144-1307(+)